MAQQQGLMISSIKGHEGRVRMPDVGILVGWFSDWSLSRKSQAENEAATYTLKATFGHCNEVLWRQDYRKEITLKLGKDAEYLAEGDEVEFGNNKLRMDNVRISRVGDAK